jgi:hypothetical protein
MYKINYFEKHGNYNVNSCNCSKMLTSVESRDLRKSFWNREKNESIKKVQNGEIENVAGSV